MRLPARLAKRLVAVEQRAATSEIDLIFKKYRGMKALRMAMEAVKAAQTGEAPREPAEAGLWEAILKEQEARKEWEAKKKNKDRPPES
jgi:hypothetical protein